MFWERPYKTFVFVRFFILPIAMKGACEINMAKNSKYYKQLHEDIYKNNLYCEYITIYQDKTDEELYQYLRHLAAKLGRPPLKADVPGYYYIKKRLGSWPRILEQAGLKQVTERRKKKLAQRRKVKEEKLRLKNAESERDKENVL